MYDEDGLMVWLKMSVSFGGQDQTVEINKTSKNYYKNKLNFNSYCIDGQNLEHMKVPLR